MENKRMGSKKKVIYGIIGMALLLTVTTGGNLKLLGDWSTGEMAGYNIFTIFSLVFGVAFIYEGFRK